MTARLILASASPRRHALLAELGIAFDVVPSDVPETILPGEAPADFAVRLAREKALAVARTFPAAHVLGADTVVIVGQTVLGKPVDRDDAWRMLTTLSARTHRVWTAVALVAPSGELDEIGVETAVEFRALEPSEIEAYLDTGESFDKAGAYGVQGGGAGFVVRLDGSYSNVMGLPVEEVAAMLRRRLPVGSAPSVART
ncbi:Maf family protein [Candidatus Binatia bacterium]|nr:Maf family protein [Candidatus Binatia bacterium]